VQQTNSGDLVLVTGASGFIAKHVIKAALERGYRVRGTLRRPDAEQAIRTAVHEYGRQLSFVTADLLADDGWETAAHGCRYVFHVASAFPLVAPADRQELVPVARDGTLRVLRAAAAAGAERTVLTSSCVAVWSGHRPDAARVFTEADWSLTDSPDTNAYAFSKTLAERAAWEFAASHPHMALTAINPSLVLGPPVDRDVDSSADMVLTFLRGRYAMVPNYGIEVVDVRDVAEAHLRAVEVPAAAGQRFIVSSGPVTMREMGRILGRALPEFKHRMPETVLPDFVSRFIARFDAGVRQVIPDLGPVKRTSTSAAREVLGIQFRPVDRAIVDMAEALVQWNMV
jgi:nucleoside-diphosphate-sugar epimerase